MEKKVHNHLKLLGCTSPIQISLAYQVFIELFDVKLMHDVEFFYNVNLRLPYLTAKTAKNTPAHIFVPHSTSEPITMSYIEEVQKNICTNSSQPSVTLACIEGDSTIVFYTFTKDLINLQNPECFVRQKTREERKDYLENEIRKNRNALLLQAYNQSVIDE
ncbi:uncharacterized protein LOC143918135 [Arctopsyche grandis]|uniref:uncharacterized protein LOC143918135 n=1 Tax=Arctopsyche grandis TaxID=121162 RepID=UPI00406D9A6F